MKKDTEFKVFQVKKHLTQVDMPFHSEAKHRCRKRWEGSNREQEIRIWVVEYL